MLGEVVAVSIPVNDSDCSFEFFVPPFRFKTDFDRAVVTSPLSSRTFKLDFSRAGVQDRSVMVGR